MPGASESRCNDLRKDSKTAETPRPVVLLDRYCKGSCIGCEHVEPYLVSIAFSYKYKSFAAQGPTTCS